MKILKREIQFNPAFDKRDPDPKRSYGVGAVTMRWLLHTDRGICQFYTFTNWYLPEVEKEWEMQGAKQSKVFPADIGYHVSVPQYEGHKAMDCDLLPNGKCFYDGSGLQADDFFETLIREGHEAVWKKMEQWFQHVYDNAEEINAEP